MPNVIPPNNVAAGDPNHVLYHNNISDVLTAHVERMDAYEATIPTMRGYLNQVEDLPTNGSFGDMYVVGEDMALYYWGVTQSSPTPAWRYSGTIRGEQGPAGPSGSIVGVLEYGENPPPGTPANTLWFVAEQSAVLPGPDLTPVLVGSSAHVNHATSSVLSVSGAGINTQAGDVAVLCVVHASSAVIATPSNWENPTALNAAYTRAIDGNTTATIFTRVCPDAMGNVNIVAGEKHSCSLMVFRNVDLAAGGLAHNINSIITTTDSATRAAPTLTPTVDSIVCGFYFDRYGPSQTVPLAASVAQPAVFTKAASGGVNQSGSSSIVSSQGGYDLTVAKDAARPAGTQNWVKTGPVGTQLGAFTLALAKKTG
jgi:hypothetical protein